MHYYVCLAMTCSMWKFLDQGLNPFHSNDPCHSNDPSHISDNARALITRPQGNSILIFFTFCLQRSQENTIGKGRSLFFVCFLFALFCLFATSWAASVAYGGSQARGQIGAVATATGLRQSHSNAGPKPHLRPTPQLRATLDP